MEKECIDWHYIKYERGTCDWYDFQDQFKIMRHALRFSVPLLTNGDVDCEKDGQRAYPRTDYSKGFPNWWWLDHVDIQVPSSHVQEGKRYDAEVILAHFYEFGHSKNQVRLYWWRFESAQMRSTHTISWGSLGTFQSFSNRMTTPSHGLSSISSSVNGDSKRKKSDLLVDWNRPQTMAGVVSSVGRSLHKDG
jgi:hypothetical protein